MSVYVTKGALVEYQLDADSTSYAERITYGSTKAFAIRTSGVLDGVGATGFSTASADFVTPPWARGIEIYGVVSAVTSGTSGNATVQLALQPLAPSGSYLSGSSWISGGITGSTALFNGTSGDSYMTIYPGITAVSGGLVGAYSAVAPQQFRVLTTLAGSSYSGTLAITGRFVP